MSDTPTTPDDPRLTAYVLDELTDAERATIEAHLATSPDSRRVVDDLRQTTALLFTALQDEPAPALTGAQRQTIRTAAATSVVTPSRTTESAAVISSRTVSSHRRAVVTALITVLSVSVAILFAVLVPLSQHPTSEGIAMMTQDAWLDLDGSNFAITENLGDLAQQRLDYFHLSESRPETEEETLLPLMVTPRIIIQPSEENGLDSVDHLSLEGLVVSSDSKAQPATTRQAGPLTDQLPPIAPFGSVDPINSQSGQSSTRFLSFGVTKSANTAPTTSLGTRLQPTFSTPATGSVIVQDAQPRLPSPTYLNDDVQYQPAGVVIPEMFTADLDVPFRQGSFGLGIPSQEGSTDGFTVRQLILEPSVSNEQAPQLWYFIPNENPRVGTESYAPIVENPFTSPNDAPLSTFGLDVDTASYANVRRFLLDAGRMPPPDAVRIEELVNYFSYDDPQPVDEHPLRVTLESAACPWDASHRLVRVGVRGKEMDLADRPPTSLVFLIDTSGSMRDDNKLPLVKESLRLLVDEMTENDRIAIVTYSNDAGLVLDSTSGEHRDEIMSVIDALQANGSTNGEAGLKSAYDVATQHRIANGSNRVILCTDGDFNVGESADAPLVRMISEKRDTGVSLSICGFGSGNLKDAKLEQIADHGNGQYHYIDGLRQARKVFLDELSGTLYTIAKDVKLQVEFNPSQVGAYRLIGYENRTLAAEDFSNDRVDAGDLGAGHSVTALYEIVPPDGDRAKPTSAASGVDPLKYQKPRLAAPQREALTQESQISNLKSEISTELLTVKLRYKPALPLGSRLNEAVTNESIKLEFPLVDEADDDTFSNDLEWAAAVASFGMLLRNSAYRGQATFDRVFELAQHAIGDDRSGRRHEFIDLVLKARQLQRQSQGTRSHPPTRLSSLDARRQASLDGHYRELLDKFERPADFQQYGAVHNRGWWTGPDDADEKGLPAGYWVYVYPHWYVWGETVGADSVSPDSDPNPTP